MQSFKISRPTPEYKRAALEAIRKAIPGIDSKAQCERIRVALAQFSITTYEASRYLDCYNPPARVWQLRDQGTRIATQWETIETESGDRHRVGLYVMSGAQ